jgi:hypothetical protein
MNLKKIHALAWIALTRDDLPGHSFIQVYQTIFGEQPNMVLIRIEARKFEQFV